MLFVAGQNLLALVYVLDCRLPGCCLQGNSNISITTFYNIQLAVTVLTVSDNIYIYLTIVSYDDSLPSKHAVIGTISGKDYKRGAFIE